MKKNLSYYSVTLLFTILTTLLVSCSTEKETSIPFTMEEGRIFIPVKVNGKAYDFLFDTGADGIGRIDSSLVSELNLSIIGQSNNSDGINVSKIDNVEIDLLECGNLGLDSPTLSSRNYNRGRKNSKFIYGIIGRGFWEDYVLTIDYENRIIHFTKQPLESSATNTVSYENELEIPIEVGNFKTTANIDTGSTLVMHIPRKYKDNFETSELEKAGTGRRANTQFHFWKAQLNDDVKIAGSKLKNLKVLFSDQANHINIGSGLLKQFKVSIDQKNRLMAFEVIKLNENKNELVKIDAKPNKGFNHGYFIFIPKGTSKEKTHHLLVEPNNSGTINDTLAFHEQRAKHLASVNSSGNYIARKLETPFIVPIFPRPASDPFTYTNALDRDVMLIKEGDLKRLDVQLVNIIKDARKTLKSMGYKTQEKAFFNGFSATGTFLNRFAFLQPEIIAGVSTGAVNGTLMFPIEELGGEKLIYPIGLYDFKEISGKDFNREAYLKVPQFIYMGAKDTNDAVQYDDAFSEEERQIIYKVFGKEMQPKRWENSQKVYQEKNLNAQLITFDHIGHGTDRKVLDSIVQFFKELDKN